MELKPKPKKHIITLSAKPTECSNTPKQFVDNCLSVFEHFVWLALKGLTTIKLTAFLPTFNQLKQN